MSVLTDRDGPVSIITINRPAARNAVNPETARDLFHAFAESERDESVLVTVLTGAGGAFCAGFDLKVAANPPRDPLPSPGPQAGPMGPSRLLADRSQAEPGVSLSKPVIAAVEGHAVAGGLELALLADMRVA